MKKCLSKINTKTICSKKGFTLIEVIVVIGIMLIITGLTLFDGSRLNSSVSLSNTTYELGLMIRDAQVSGLGSKVVSDSSITTLNQGIHFDMTTPEKFILFADSAPNNIYDSLEQTEIYNIENKRAGKILKICKISPDGKSCGNTISNLSIVFKRPNPEAYFYFKNGSSVEEHVGNIAINLGFTGPNPDCRSIVIYKTGAIQIDKSFCN